MANFSDIKSLDALLIQSKFNKSDDTPKPTHTRIGNAQLKIFGGSYHIDLSKKNIRNKFFKLYNRKVLKKGFTEYLTELQDKQNGGPMLIDLDFKFGNNLSERIFDADIISDMVSIYVEQIMKLYDLSCIKTFEIYVLLKDDMVEDDMNNCIKDGIHIHILLKTKHDSQMVLRKHVLVEMDNQVLDDIEHINDIDDIFDKSITSGNTGWLLYGSRKPGGEPYKLKYKYDITLDDDDYEIDSKNIEDETSIQILTKLSLSNDIPLIELKESFKKEAYTPTKQKNTIVIKENHIGKDWIIKSFQNITNEQNCESIIAIILSNEQNSLSNISEINNYVMHCLDEKYYEPRSEWIRVMWAMKNINPLLYPFFLKWSSQSDKFDWSDTVSIFKQWNETKSNTFTEGSIRYWSKISNPDEYKMIRDNTTNSFIENTLLGKGTDHDIAKLIHHLMFDSYRCTSIKGNGWFRFRNHRWITSESGTGLRRKFSSFISPLYIQKQTEIMEKIRTDNDMSQETQDKLTHEAAIYNKISMRLKSTSQKNNIMTESKELHFDNKLENRLDENPYLLCFKNGIFDFEQKMFRDGIPEDYVSKCTDIDYVRLDKNNAQQQKIISEINEFMDQLFPNKRLCRYVWEHFASCLLGTNQNQTFNIYTGVGSNGKSVLVKLLSMILGDYKGTVPISLITQKRLGLGGTSSEVAQLKGLRYAVMNEPSKGDEINEGIMKELTGGDPIQARELYKSSITFIPMFKMACCTNTLFDIKSNDEGTWRRIRVVDFQSKFIEKPSDDPNDFEFKKDKSLEKKFLSWAPIFASLLVDIVLKTNGTVEDCDEVLSASRQYRENQDYLAKFVSDKIKPWIFNGENPEKTENKISKTNIQNEFKEWWKREYNTRCPKSQELVNYLNVKLGLYKKRGWWGYEIIYDEYDSD
tara:strand:+ start:18360 stop:21122 length:2763 start_codon:yes stop_codon:yes gene_type:complete